MKLLIVLLIVAAAFWWFLRPRKAEPPCNEKHETGMCDNCPIGADCAKKQTET